MRSQDPHHALRRLRAAWLALLLVLPLGAAACSDEETVYVPPVTYNELIRGCIAATACGVKAYPRVYNCVDSYYSLLLVFGYGRIYDAIYHCVNEAQGNCDTIYQCFGPHRKAGRCDQTFEARCDGDRAISCDLLDHRVFVHDCAAAGLKCAVKNTDTFAAECAYGTCVAGYKARCEEKKKLTCEDGVIIVEDCEAQGLVCGKDSKGNSVCQGTTKTTCGTTSLYKPSCQKDVALSCQGERVQKTDCAKQIYNQKCNNGACVSTAGSCSTNNFDRCQGGNLEYCLDGKWISQDCAEMGFGPCRTVTNGARCGISGK